VSGNSPDLGPLSGKCVLLLRPAHQAPATAAAVRSRGAESIVFPVMEIDDPPDSALVDRTLRALSGYDWVLFTSANGVERTAQALQRLGLGMSELAALDIGVIGPRTARSLEQYGLQAQLVARKYVAEELGRALLARGPLRRVLLLRALEAREVLPDMLAEAGVAIDVVPVYQTRTVAPERAVELADLLEQRQPAAVIFTSSSTVAALCELLRERTRDLLASSLVASIGPITSATARELGISVDVEARSHTVEGVLDELEQKFGG
jgi:uroporphyrinogen III methyltransferase/synthase